MMIPPGQHMIPPEAILNHHEPTSGYIPPNLYNYPPMRHPLQHPAFGPPPPHTPTLINAPPPFNQFLHPEYRLYELNKRLQQRSEDSDNLWWDSLVAQFFDDDAKLTMSFCLEDGPKRYCINRTLIPRFFRSVFEGGAIDLYFLPRHWKEIYHGPPQPVHLYPSPPYHPGTMASGARPNSPSSAPNNLSNNMSGGNGNTSNKDGITTNSNQSGPNANNPGNNGPNPGPNKSSPPTTTIFIPTFLTMDCEQANMITVLDKPILTKVISEGRLILDFIIMEDSSLRIKRWHYIIRHHTELIPRNILSMQDPAVLEQLSKNITRSGLTNTTLNYLRLCVILEPMAELMSRHKAYALSPRDCMKTTLFQKWQKLVGNNENLGPGPHPSQHHNNANGLMHAHPHHAGPQFANGFMGGGNGIPPGMRYHTNTFGGPPQHSSHNNNGSSVPVGIKDGAMILPLSSQQQTNTPTINGRPGSGSSINTTGTNAPSVSSTPVTSGTTTTKQTKPRRKRKTDANQGTGTSPGKKRGSAAANANSNANSSTSTNNNTSTSVMTCNASTSSTKPFLNAGNPTPFLQQNNPYNGPPPNAMFANDGGRPTNFYPFNNPPSNMNNNPSPMSNGPNPSFPLNNAPNMGMFPSSHPPPPPYPHHSGPTTGLIRGGPPPGTLPPFNPQGQPGISAAHYQQQQQQHMLSLASQDVMIVGEPTLMGGEFGDEDERLIARLENLQYMESHSSTLVSQSTVLHQPQTTSSLPHHNNNSPLTDQSNLLSNNTIKNESIEISSNNPSKLNNGPLSTLLPNFEMVNGGVGGNNNSRNRKCHNSIGFMDVKNNGFIDFKDNTSFIKSESISGGSLGLDGSSPFPNTPTNKSDNGNLTSNNLTNNNSNAHIKGSPLSTQMMLGTKCNIPNTVAPPSTLIHHNFTDVNEDLLLNNVGVPPPSSLMLPNDDGNDDYRSKIGGPLDRSSGLSTPPLIESNNNIIVNNGDNLLNNHLIQHSSSHSHHSLNSMGNLNAGYSDTNINSHLKSNNNTNSSSNESLSNAVSDNNLSMSNNHVKNHHNMAYNNHIDRGSTHHLYNNNSNNSSTNTKNNGVGTTNFQINNNHIDY